MKIKKNIKKAGVGLLVSAIAITGAFSWLTDSTTATKTNDIKIGTFGIKFENQENAVTLVDNSAIPMTKAYAIENLTPYTFNIANKGDLALDYEVLVSNTDYANTFEANAINVLIAPILDTATDEEIKNALSNATLQKVSAGKDLTFSSLNGLQAQRYALLAFVDKTVELTNYTGKTASFKLEVQAVQHRALNAENYETLSKSQIATTITAGGESKNVEVYNIEGESKTDLLNKLQASGLTETADVDAIVEVCGDDYDGLNTTATFDVSSIANPGDEVVILHYNEETQEWEYIGRETVANDGTVSGDFTSYSPVAFVVYKPDGSTVTKEYDSETGALIKETETKANGTTITTVYGENGEITSVESKEEKVITPEGVELPFFDPEITTYKRYESFSIGSDSGISWYDSRMNLISTEVESIYGEYENTMIVYTGYDSNGNKKAEATISATYENGAYTYLYLTPEYSKYICNENGLITIDEIYNTDTKEKTAEKEYTYDLNDNVTKTELYIYYNGDKMLSTQDIFEYENNELIKNTSYGYNAYGDGSLSSVTERTYENGKETSQKWTSYNYDTKTISNLSEYTNPLGYFTDGMSGEQRAVYGERTHTQYNADGTINNKTVSVYTLDHINGTQAHYKTESVQHFGNNEEYLGKIETVRGTYREELQGWDIETEKSYDSKDKVIRTRAVERKLNGEGFVTIVTTITDKNGKITNKTEQTNTPEKSTSIQYYHNNDGVLYLYTVSESVSGPGWSITEKAYNADGTPYTGELQIDGSSIIYYENGIMIYRLLPCYDTDGNLIYYSKVGPNGENLENCDEDGNAITGFVLTSTDYYEEIGITYKRKFGLYFDNGSLVDGKTVILIYNNSTNKFVYGIIHETEDDVTNVYYCNEDYSMYSGKVTISPGTTYKRSGMCENGVIVFLIDEYYDEEGEFLNAERLELNNETLIWESVGACDENGNLI